MSELIREINTILGVDHQFTTAYHPQTNGQVKIYNKLIANMLSHFVSNLIELFFKIVAFRLDLLFVENRLIIEFLQL